MRVAVTDYDGILCVCGRVGDDVLTAISAWRSAGNAFGIATGRDLSMVRHAVETWHVPFDFLVCVSGAVLYDNDYSLLYHADIADEIVPHVLKHPAAKASMHYQLCGAGVSYLHMRDEKSWFPKVGSSYTLVSCDDALEMKGLQQISLSYFSAEEGRQYTEDLTAAFGDYILPHQNGPCIDITAHGVSKASGILELLRLKEWPESGLLAIGDSENDLSMIRRFGGFTVQNAVGEVKGAAQGVYESVGAMLRVNM